MYPLGAFQSRESQTPIYTTSLKTLQYIHYELESSDTLVYFFVVVVFFLSSSSLPFFVLVDLGADVIVAEAALVVAAEAEGVTAADEGPAEDPAEAKDDTTVLSVVCLGPPFA